MSAATSATMSLRASRPVLIRRVVRGPANLPVAPRHFRCRARGPEECGQLPPLQSEQQDNRCRDRPTFRRRRGPELWARGPFRRFDSLLREFDDLLGLTVPQPFDTPAAASLQSLMGLEVNEDDTRYSIKADVPGFSKDSIKITLSEDGVLSIEGRERQQETATPKPEGEEAADAPTTTSRSERSFVRRLQVPDNVQFDGIEAKVEHGQLFLTLPKRVEQPKPDTTKEIPIAGN